MTQKGFSGLLWKNWRENPRWLNPSQKLRFLQTLLPRSKASRKSAEMILVLAEAEKSTRNAASRNWEMTRFSTSHEEVKSHPFEVSWQKRNRGVLKSGDLVWKGLRANCTVHGRQEQAMTKKNELGVPTSRWFWMTVVVLILAMVGAGVRNYFFGPYADLKKRVHEIGNERIQEWAVNLLNSHHPIRKVEKIPPADIPDDIQAAFQGGYLVPAQ